MADYGINKHPLLCRPPQKNTSAALLSAMFNIQSALLTFKGANEEPTTIQQANIAIFVQR